MTSSKEPKPSEYVWKTEQEPKQGGPLTVTGFYDALNKTDKEYSAISWGGFNLFGSRKDIQEVQRLLNKESYVKPLQDLIQLYKDREELMKRRIAELEGRLDQNAD
jgi:hypothetical protein